MRKLFIFSIILAFAPLFVYAHGDKYLEFNPDATSSLKVSDVETPSQVFFAQNDFLGGFDVWLANPGSSGTATFSLLNEQGLVISSRTVTIPAIAQTSNGTKFHIDLSSQLAVLSSGKYSLRIISSMPQLRLYYSDRIKLISYDTPFVSEYITGVGKLGSEEQPFSFKYALYEITEVSAPIISNIAWTVISGNEMKIDFNANEPVDYKIEYGIGGYTLSTNFLNDYELCVQGISNCSINIPVSPNTTYQYRLTVKDSWGNQSQATGTFTSGVGQTPVPTVAPSATSSVTPAPSVTPLADTTPPVISNLRIAEVTNNSVNIAWTTNEAANSYLGIVQGPYLIAANSDATFELEHLLGTNSVLSPNATYLARINSYDLSNNLTVASISFTTTGTLPTPTPVPTPPGSTPPPPISTGTPQPSPTITVLANPSGTGSDTTIQWGAPIDGEPNDGYRIDIFNEDGSLNKTIYVPQGSHSLQASDLAEGDYTAIVYANNDGVYEKVDKPVPIRVVEGDSFFQRLLGFWPYLLIVAGLIVIFILWEMKKMHKASQAPQTPVS